LLQRSHAPKGCINLHKPPLKRRLAAPIETIVDKDLD
jgi:hypothetical protein